MKIELWEPNKDDPNDPWVTARVADPEARVAIAHHLGLSPAHHLDERCRQSQRGRLLDRLEQQQRFGARGAVTPLARGGTTVRPRR